MGFGFFNTMAARMRPSLSFPRYLRRDIVLPVNGKESTSMDPSLFLSGMLDDLGNRNPAVTKQQRIPAQAVASSTLPGLFPAPFARTQPSTV